MEHMGQKAGKLILIDAVTSRRATISHAMVGLGMHVEPFEDVDEILRHWPSGQVALVEDVDENIAALIDYMTDTGRWLPIVGFSEQPTTHKVAAAIHLGAIDYLSWPCGPGEILMVIQQAEIAGSALGTNRQREAHARSRILKLTRREREVLACVAGGLSNRRIGEHLSISPRTVEIHRANMLTKIGANHTSEAIRLAIEASLVA